MKKKQATKKASTASTSGTKAKGKAKSPRASKSNSNMSANTAAILGLSFNKRGQAQSNGTPRIRPEWMKYYNRLLDLREQLRNQMAGLAKESAEQMHGYSLHMADSGTDNFDRDFALSLLSSDQDAVYEIEEALKRIERNTFGVCELTGKNIPKARLDAIPWARFTVEAQMQLEKEGAMRGRRLGALGSIDSAGSFDSDDDDSSSSKDSK